MKKDNLSFDISNTFYRLKIMQTIIEGDASLQGFRKIHEGTVPYLMYILVVEGGIQM